MKWDTINVITYIMFFTENENENNNNEYKIIKKWDLFIKKNLLLDKVFLSDNLTC